MYNKIAVVGNKDSVFAFKAVGIDVSDAQSADEAKEEIKKLAAKGYKVIFITEDLAEQAEEFIEKYKAKTYPAIIPIPKGGESTGYAMNGLKKDMEKAIGADILFKDKQ